MVLATNNYTKYIFTLLKDKPVSQINDCWNYSMKWEYINYSGTCKDFLQRGWNVVDGFEIKQTIQIIIYYLLKPFPLVSLLRVTETQGMQAKPQPCITSEYRYNLFFHI